MACAFIVTLVIYQVVELVLSEPTALIRILDANGPFSKYQTSKIVNGQQANRGQFPHQAALYLDKRSFCGGSLISSEWVLTAAHCTQGLCSSEFQGFCSSAETATVRLGSQNLRADEEGRKSFTSRQFLVHEDYNDTTLNNDISLIKLPTSVPPSPFIFPVNLPSPSEVNMTFENRTALVSGWGRTLDNATSISDELNFVNLTILTNSECSESYVPGVVISSTVCARGTEQRSTCRGDSGGPLVVNRATNYTQGDRSSNYTQIGVVSFVARSGCARGAPSGYVRVTSFLDWLATNTGRPERSLPSKANKPNFRKRTSKFEKAVQKFASGREESVVTGLFRRGQHSSIMNRALPLNELSQAYLENDLHRIIDLANKQSRSVGSSQDNGKAESRRSLVPRLYGQTESEAVDSPALQALVEPRQLSPLCYYRETGPSMLPVVSFLPFRQLKERRFSNSQLRESKDKVLIHKTCSFFSGDIGFSPKASSTRMVHGGPYAPVSVVPPNKSTLNLSTISSSDEDDSHNLGYQAFSAACEKSVSAVSKRLCELCKYITARILQSPSTRVSVTARILQSPSTRVFSHSKDPPVSIYPCFSHSKDPPGSSHGKDPPVSSHSKDPPVSSQRGNHTNPQQTTATQTRQSECHETTSPSSPETLPEHLPLSETILDPLEYLKKVFGDAPMNFNISRTAEKNRSKEATVSTYESDMSRLIDTHVYPSTSWERGSLQPGDRDWYSPDPRETRVYQELEERRTPCASYPCQGSSVKDYEDEGQLNFPASSATGMSPETRFASLVTSPPIVYWKRSMF
uniref:Peptidase S1 domain-containing protein n=1 Tax=Timema poppense TaxID=170557 RepID=A0A7R9D8V3_TIMPO|nr:unnamed protein product [Timema poppensis]